MSSIRGYNELETVPHCQSNKSLKQGRIKLGTRSDKIHLIEYKQKNTSGKSFPCERLWQAKHSWDHVSQRQSWRLVQTGFSHQMASSANGYRRGQSWAIRSTPDRCHHRRWSKTALPVAPWRPGEPRTSVLRHSTHECPCRFVPGAG